MYYMSTYSSIILLSSTHYTFNKMKPQSSKIDI